MLGMQHVPGHQRTCSSPQMERYKTVIARFLFAIAAAFWLSSIILGWSPSASFSGLASESAVCRSLGQCRHSNYTFQVLLQEDHSSVRSQTIPEANERQLKVLGDDDSSSWIRRREFRGYGCAAHVFVEFGSYRSSGRQFSIIGLASKPLHIYGNPKFSCEWIPAVAAAAFHLTDGEVSSVAAAAGGPSHLQGKIMKDLPDFGYGRVYTAVVITCSFDVNVGTDAKGGRLILHAHRGDSWSSSSTTRAEDRIVALIESPGDYDAAKLIPPYPYDLVYCGSPLFGRVNARRAREWIAYHDLLFGERCHFIFYDAGGMHEGVFRALLPWVRLGRASIHDVRSTVQFDGYYYNQFVIVNDCLHRSKFLANWTFFFDLDEYLYVEPAVHHSPQSLLATLKTSFEENGEDLVEVNFKQYRMARNLCHSPKNHSRRQPLSKQWGFEKLTYRDLSSQNRDVKYVCNPKKVYATGVHGVENYSPGGVRESLNETLARYYHYHGTLDDENGDEDDQILCQNTSERTREDDSCSRPGGNKTEDGRTQPGNMLEYDGSMMPFSLKARRHETHILHSTTAPRSPKSKASHSRQHGAPPD